MVYSLDFRWRIVTLIHVYGLEISFVSDLFGPKPRTITRWYSLFRAKGVVQEDSPPTVTSRWPPDVVIAVEQYVKKHPTFYIEELQDYLTEAFPTLGNVSLSTICRALNFDLQLTRKSLTKAAREAVPLEVRNYQAKLKAIYSYPSQLIFIDETSKDGRDAYRKYARSKRGTTAVVKLPFSRGRRVSVLAALDVYGFCAWKTTRGTFTRKSFHDGFCSEIIPLLNPWLLPRSIVVMDNAKIHAYKEL